MQSLDYRRDETPRAFHAEEDEEWCPAPVSSCPERDVVACIVMRAVEDLGAVDPPRPTIKVQRVKTQAKTIAEDAFWWLFVDEGERVMSLSWCCDVLGLTKRDVRLYAGREHPQVCWRKAGVWAEELEHS